MSIKKIACAGCHRSGSTWLFNAVRLIMETTGQEVYSCFATEYDAENTAPIHVVKCHNKRKFLLDSDRIFTTKRDLRDIAASAVRRELIDQSECIDYLYRLLKQEYRPWKPLSHLEIKYEDLIRNQNLYVQNIAKILRVKVKPAVIRKKIESLSIPKGENQRDPVSLLHSNHITDGTHGSYKKTLSPYMQDLIQATFHNWLARNDYL
jgi:hypothetical protein